MKTIEEKELFSAHITLAAKALGIGLGRIHLETGYRYVWNDMGKRIECASAATDQEALYRACEELQKYLQIPWHKEQDRPDSDIYGPLTD